MHNDQLKKERTYDHDRLDRHLWQRRRETGLSRRELLASLAAGTGAAMFGGLVPEARAALPAAVKDTSKLINRGTNFEMRWDLLPFGDYLTPLEHFFIRNHVGTPTISTNDWQLSIEGSGVDNPITIDYEELLDFRDRTVVNFIECAGNARSFFNTQQTQTPAAAGTPWLLGAVGVAAWTGVRLSDVLECAGLKEDAVDVMPWGGEDPHPTLGNVRRPMSVEKALDDVLLVFKMNGQPLPPDHGGPVRVLVPGWIGVSNVKWVNKITVETSRIYTPFNTSNYTYRGFGYGYEGASPAPDAVILTKQDVKSAFHLPFPGTLSRGLQLLKGRSWSAHSSIKKVEVSVDGGDEWHSAILLPPNLPQAWVRWVFPWCAEPGSYTLMARATDKSGKTQPLTVPPNTNGYSFWAVVEHPVTVS